MSDQASLAPTPDAPQPDARVARSRNALLRRLADVVCLPGSRVNAFERSMTADLLVEMLREASPDERRRVAVRLSGLTEIPTSLVRLLLRDPDIEVARPLLELCASLNDADLLDCVRASTTNHRKLIAARRPVSDVISEALVEKQETEVIETLLRNKDAILSAAAIEALVADSRNHPRFVAGLLKRPELRPSHAYVMFWWSDPDARRVILQRFAVSREILQEAAGDVFPMAAAENWADPLTRKALQFIERRQRNRAAIEQSPFASLENAIEAAKDGLTREIAEEISYLAGLKPTTGAKLFTDRGGEPLAILCKATGLPKAAIRALWQAMKRPPEDAEKLERVMITYDMMAVDRAQTVLRYWNWALSSALTPALLKAIREGDEEGVDEYTTPQRAALLALSRDFAS